MADDLQSPEQLAWEKRVLEKIRAGDREALGELYQRFARALYRRILLPRLSNEAAAEDALAETFKTAMGHLDRYEERGTSIWYWLARIAANKAIDMHRSRARKERALVNFENMIAPLAREGEPMVSDYEYRQWRDQVRQLIDQVLETINPRYRRAIVLRFFDGRARAVCAEEMGVKVGTFDVVLLRSLKAFRAKWEDCVASLPNGGL